MIHNCRRRRRRRRVERFRDATTTNSCCLLPAGRVDRPRSDGAACSKSSVFQLADLTALRAYLRETHWSLSRVVRSAAADVAGRRRLRSASRGRVKLWSTCVLFCRSLRLDSLSLRRALRLELTTWAYPAININSCLQALTEDISTPADIAPSALETIIFYCFMGYIISALTYYFELCARCLSSTY